jgi:hypothetical protein
VIRRRVTAIRAVAVGVGAATHCQRPDTKERPETLGLPRADSDLTLLPPRDGAHIEPIVAVTGDKGGGGGQPGGRGTREGRPRPKLQAKSLGTGRRSAAHEAEIKLSGFSPDLWPGQESGAALPRPLPAVILFSTGLGISQGCGHGP